MANPERIPDPRTGAYPDTQPIPGVDPMLDPRVDPANPRVAAANATDPYAASPRVSVTQRSGGSGMLIAGIIIVLAIAAYVMFAPGTSTTTAPTDPAVTSEPAAPAPDATAPAAAPADPATTAPDATAPAAPADPAAPAPDAASPAPAEPAPAAPAQ